MDVRISGAHGFHFLAACIYRGLCTCRLFGFNSGKLRMDERIDLSMSDLDLVPLLIQVFYFGLIDACINFLSALNRERIVK